MFKNRSKLKCFTQNRPFNSTNCLICILSPLFRLWSTISPITEYSCPHRNPNVIQAKLSRTKKAQNLALLTNSFILISFSSAVIKLSLNRGSVFQERNVDDFFLIITLVYYSAFFCFMYVNNRYVRSFSGIIKLIHKRKLYGIDEILTKSICKRYTFYYYVSICSICILILDFLLGVIKNPNIFNILIGIGTTISYVNSFNIFISGVVILDLYLVLFRACLNAIKSSLNKKSEISLPFKKRLQFLGNFYMAIVYNYKLHMSSVMSPSLWALFSFLYFICVDIYFYIAYIELSYPLTSSFLHFRICFEIICGNFGIIGLVFALNYILNIVKGFLEREMFFMDRFFVLGRHNSTVYLQMSLKSIEE